MTQPTISEVLSILVQPSSYKLNRIQIESHDFIIFLDGLEHFLEGRPISELLYQSTLNYGVLNSRFPGYLELGCYKITTLLSIINNSILTENKSK